MPQTAEEEAEASDIEGREVIGGCIMIGQRHQEHNCIWKRRARQQPGMGGRWLQAGVYWFGLVGLYFDLR